MIVCYLLWVLDDSGDYVHHIMKWIMRLNAWVWIFEGMHEWLMHDIHDKFMMHFKLNRLTFVCCLHCFPLKVEIDCRQAVDN